MWSRKTTDTYLQRAALVVVLLLVAVAAVSFGGQTPREFAGVVGLGVLAGVLWVMRLWTSDRPRLFLHPILAVVLGFLAYAGWRSTQVVVPYLAVGELLQLGLYALVFVVVLLTLGGREESSWLAHALVTLGAGLSVYALIQYLNHSDYILGWKQPAVYSGRAGATFVNPNHFAAFLVPIVPLALAQALISRQDAWLRVSHGLAAVLLYVGIGVSMSRGGWFASGIVTLAFLVWMMARRPQLRRVAIGVLGLFVIATAMFVSLNAKARARIEGVNTEGNVESGLRRYIWQPAWREFGAHRVWGVGPAQFRVHFSQFRTPLMQSDPGWCHNEYLNLLCDYGLVGAGLVLLGIVIMALNLYRVRKYVDRGGSELGSKGSDRTAMFVGVNLGLLGLALHSFGDFILHTPAVALLATIFAALSAASLRHASDRFRVSVPAWLPVILLAGVVGAGAWLLPRAYRRAREGSLLAQAEQATTVSTNLFNTLIAAARLEPLNPRTAYELGENYRRLSFAGDPGWRSQGEQAVKWLERASALNPLDPFPHLKLGLTWHWLGDAAKAKRSIERAVDLGPNQVEIANHYAWNLLLQGRPRKARVVLNDSVTWNWWDNWMARKYLAEIDAGKWPDRETH